jgi:hypothetical protein
MSLRTRLVCVSLLLGLSGCLPQSRLTGADDRDDGRTPSRALSENGADGSDGEDGVDGADGIDGADGVEGTGGFDGADGADGVDGADGSDGLSSLVRVSEAEASEACPAGGSVVEAGIDRDRNLELGDEEVDSSALICNGHAGADAFAEVQDVEDEPCLFDNADGVPQLICADGVRELTSGPLMPRAATASSVGGGWSPARAAFADQSGWMSEIAADDGQWLQYDFGAPVVLTHVRAHAVAGRAGRNLVIQGSKDGSEWVDIHALDNEASFGAGPWHGYVTIDETISSSDAYRFVRLQSDPHPFLFYAYLGFDGAVVQ